MSDDLLEQFVIEGRELTQQATDDLFALEGSPGDTARLDAVFRAFHTLKGSAGLFSFAPMGEVLHAAEDLADAVRAGEAALAPATIDTFLACIGLVEGWIEAVAQTGMLPGQAADEARDFTARLHTPTVAAEAPAVAPPAWMPDLVARHPGTAAVTALRYVPTPDCFFRGDDPLELLRGVPGLIALDVRQRDAVDPAALEPFNCNLVIEALSTAPASDIRPIFRLVPDQAEIATVPRAEKTPEMAPVVAPPVARSMRVDAARIDRLADIATELMVAKNQLGHLARAAEANPAGLHRALLANQLDIERLVGELHRAVSAARTVTLAQALQRLPRLVRDTAARLGKSVALDLQGGDIEVEKRIADGLFEPLLHTLRNSVDHGIEPTSIRLAAGKPENGRVVVRARQHGGRVVIEVSDDGRGIDPGAMRRAAGARGLMDQATLDALDDAAAIDLIFAPGFSTAETISDISGRGVGLDAVRSSLAAIGGLVEVASTPGQGTTVRFTVPQAVVVTTLVQVSANGQSFGIPIAAIAETVRLPLDRIVPVREGVAFALKGVTVPMLQLATLLGLEPPRRLAKHAKIVVIDCAGELVGVEVDGFGERSDVVLRPLTGLLAGLPGLLGSALMGDGAVLLALDLPALIA